MQGAQAAPFNIELPWAGFLNTQPSPVRVPRCALPRHCALQHLLRRSVHHSARAAALAHQPTQLLHSNAPSRDAHGIQVPRLHRQHHPAQPVPPGECRKQLSLNFAVLLMRSTYEAVDALDMVAMDKFQVKCAHRRAVPPTLCTRVQNARACSRSRDALSVCG